MALGTYETVLVEKENGITWVKLNRPEKRNAMSPQLCYDMVEVLRELEADEETHILVLTGQGEAFTAGMDLRLFFRDLDDKPEERAKARAADRSWNWYQLSKFPKPTIAMVNGYCFGGGFIPLCACDFAIAAEEATFGLSEVNWGILPGGLVSKVVTMTMNYRKSMYYAMTGDPFNGKTAEEIGLVTYSVPGDKLRKETIKLAENLMKKAPAVLQMTKETIRNCATMNIEESYEYILAKQEQLRWRDTENTRQRGMRDFLDEKKYRPGLTAVDRAPSGE